MKLNTWFVVAVGLALGLAGCDDDADAQTSGAHEQDASTQSTRSEHLDAGQHDDGLRIAFSPMYSAYIDDDHPCRVPAIIRGAPDGVQWKASDDSMAELQQDADGGVLITTKKAGTLEIVATVGALRSKSTLNITAFSVEEWEAGNRRYNSGIKYVAPTMEEIKAAVEAEMDSDGGERAGVKVAAWLTPPAGTTCTSCHGDSGSALSAEYTPQQTGGFSDTELATMITSGSSAARPASSEPTPPLQLMLLHSDAANLDAPQIRNLVAYMRSLAPESVRALDFPVRN